MIRARRAALAAAALLAIAAPAAAQPYPNKPIRMIVPVPPGALTDVIARRIAGEASSTLGQPFITENRPGANFMPGAEACRHSRGDGYTVCVFTTSTLTFNPHLIDNIPYNAEKDFKPVITLGAFAGGLVVSPKLNVKSMDELKAHALANPGKLISEPMARRAPPTCSGNTSTIFGRPTLSKFLTRAPTSSSRR